MGVSERREREKAKRRAAIVDAAEQVFIRDGYDASTMERVAAEAEISKGTVYLYFESKDDLRSAIAERWVAHLVERLTQTLPACETGIAGLEAVLKAMREHFEDNPRHCEMALSWVSVEPPPGDTPALEAHKQRIGELVSLVIGQVVRGQRDGTVRKDVDPPMVAMNIWATTLGIQLIIHNREHVEKRAPFPVRFEDMVPTYQRIMLDGLRAAPKEDAA
jgi:AcrR family transcriptional regulator